MSKQVLLATDIHPLLSEGLKQMGYELCYLKDTPAANWSRCEGIITSNKLKVDKQLIDKAQNLRWIGRLGSGMEIIDVAYAQKKGIACISTPDGNSNAVAEHTLGLLLSLTKNITRSAQEVQQGLWLREENRGIELEGRTVAIIGFGYTGAAFARKLQGFDVRILAYDTNEEVIMPHYVTLATMQQIHREAEIVSFHVPLKPDTHHYCNSAFVAAMKHPFFLLNTSRGEVVAQQALIEGLRTKKIIGAGLDVWPTEPPNFNNSSIFDLQKNANLILTPHIAGYTHEANYKMALSLLCKLKALLGA